MSDAEEFRATAIPRFTEAELALLAGDPGPRMALWSHRDPVTLFGALRNRRGWAEIKPVFEWLASSFSDCTAYENEIIAADASGDLAYVVALEHKTVAWNGVPAEPYTLRVTSVFRREDGEWKIVHRHGDKLVADG